MFVKYRRIINAFSDSFHFRFQRSSTYVVSTQSHMNTLKGIFCMLYNVAIEYLIKLRLFFRNIQRIARMVPRQSWLTSLGLSYLLPSAITSTNV